MASSWLALLTVWIMWGSTYLAIRLAVHTIPPLLMAGARFLIAGCVLALVLWIAQRERLTPVRWSDLRSVITTAVLLLLISNGSLSWGEQHVGSGLAALLVAGVPIWMLLIDGLFSKKIAPVALAGMIVGSAGLAILVGMPSGHVPLVTSVVLILGSICWSFGSVLARRGHGHRTHPLFPALEMIVGGALLCIVAVLSGELRGFAFSHVSVSSLGGFVWLVVMGSMVGYTAYAYAVRTLPTSVSSTYAYVNPIVAVALGALILHEQVTPNMLIGGAIIIGAVVIILLANKRKEEVGEQQLGDAA